jgi:hypothetical protein
MGLTQGAPKAVAAERGEGIVQYRPMDGKKGRPAPSGASTRTTMNQTTAGPIVMTVNVICLPEVAFRVFTEGFGEWWPFQDYSIGRERTEKAIFEGWEGGRIYEVIEGGEEATWGRVLVWDPPTRVELEWQTNPEAPGPTYVTVTFSPEGSGGRVDLEHRGWEIYGTRASMAREEYDSGWPSTLDLFANAANAAA